MKYAKPQNLPLIPNPLGVDREIQDLQILLVENISWLEYSFGRAYIGQKDQDKGNPIKFPIVYSGEGNYYDASPNDNVASQSFFLVEGAYQYNNYSNSSPNKLKVPVSLIVWGNLKKLSTEEQDYLYGNILLQDLLVVLRESYQLEISRIYDNATDVFKEFDIYKEPSSLYYFPYFCYRINFDLSTQEECKENIDLSDIVNY